MDLSLLEELCQIRSISGDESKIRTFVLDFVDKHASNWISKPTVLHGDDLQDGILLVFGTPTVAVFAHMDTVGYTAGYGAELIDVGGPSATSGTLLVGEDSISEITCELHVDEQGNKSYLYHRAIDRGTCLSYQPNFEQKDGYVRSPYLDNRLGMFVALKLASTMTNGIIAFSCYEETGGGNAEVLARIIYETYQVRQALICDITWVTSGVQHGNGVAISMRDSGIPRRSYLNKIIKIAQQAGIQYQLEVEKSGGSDGNALQRTPYPIDWCFIGAAEDQVHSSNETVAIIDINQMHLIYRLLLDEI